MSKSEPKKDTPPRPSDDKEILDKYKNQSTLSLAKIGIIALIDEATGYQNERSKDELNELLESIEE